MSEHAPSVRTRLLVRPCTLAAALLWLISAPAGAQAPTFELFWDVPATVSDNPDTAVQVSATGLLATLGIDGVDDGAQGWSISIGTEGWRIVEITTAQTVGADATSDPAGLRRGGFEKTQLTHGEGNEGAVSAIVLAFTERIFLRPADSPHRIVRVLLEGRTPAEDGLCEPCRIFFVDGRQGDGQPVENKVTYRGETFRPALGEATTDVCAVKDCCTAPINLILQTENTMVSPEPFAGDLRPACDDASPEANTFEVPVREGETGSLTAWAAIVSQLDESESGIQAWSLSLAVDGDIDVTDARIEGTATETLLRNGFSKTEVVDPTLLAPGTETEQGPGAVSAIVLSFRDPVALPLRGTSTVLELGVAATRPQGEDDITGRIVWRNFMRGSGQPVRNAATINGRTRQFCDCREAAVRFLLSTEQEFTRCDANADGRHDIADSVWIVSELFREGPRAVCQDATDCNDDEQVDLSDATYSISYEFLGGPPPPAPFPECGLDPSGDSLSCEGTSARCR